MKNLLAVIIAVSTLLLGCASNTTNKNTGITFTIPEDRYITQGEVLSRMRVYQEWTKEIQKANIDLYEKILLAQLISSKDGKPVHINRRDDVAGRYTISLDTVYGPEHVMTVEHGHVLFNHFTESDGPSVESVVTRRFKFKLPNQ